MQVPRRQFLQLSAGAAALAVSRFAWAQAYPSRPVRLIGRVEDGRGSLGHSATLRFPSPLIEPDVPD